MAIDWSDNSKRKAFRLALQRVYPSDADLKLFVDEELNENLAVMAANNNLQATAGGLVAWAHAKSRLDEVFEAFCRENSKDPGIAELRQQPLIKRSSNLEEEDWETLFKQFTPYDFADIQRAFLREFQRAFKAAFQQLRSDHPPLTEQTQIQTLLTDFDQPELAVRFVESVIVEFQRSSEGNGRDLAGLKQWRNRVVQKYNVPPLAPEPEEKMARQGYLLVTFKKHASDVTMYPELRVTGENTHIPFGVAPETCAFEKVPDYLSDWIDQAEEALNGLYDSEEILLELFLPCDLLEEDLATTWRVKDKRGNPILFSRYRLFVVRSLDRFDGEDKELIKKTSALLERKWQRLQKCVSAGNAGDNFHLQEECPKENGDLFLLLEDAPGLKFAAKLPLEHEKRKALLYGIIDAAVPIALWSSSADEAMLAELKTQMHHLCRESNLINFADLAQRWRKKLAQVETEAVKHIRLLCDCPDRLPNNVPDPEREDDLLVA